MNKKLKVPHLGLAAMLFCPVAFGSHAQSDQSDQTGATFYQNKEYTGVSTYLPESPYYHEFHGSENDLYKSVKIGILSKVFAWQHHGAGGVYREYITSNPDLTELRGMSVVKVVPNVVQGVGIRLVDKINTGKKYCLSSKVWGKGEAANVYSCTDNPEYQLVATMNPTLGGESVIASIAVRNMEPEDPNYGQFINNGSVYFKAQGGDIWVSREAG
ncbi:MAG: beta/gamma crystallin domain-containing protein [Aeromonas sp.]